MTTATDKSSTGGICHARVISHAETPASASALPSDNTPSVMAARMRGRRGRNKLEAARRGSDRRITHLTVRDYLDDLVADCHDGLAVADNHDGCTGTGALDDGTQHPVLSGGVQVRGRLVQQQHRG